jgi:hypothetical protein
MVHGAVISVARLQALFHARYLRTQDLIKFTLISAVESGGPQPNNSFKPTPHRGVGHVPALRLHVSAAPPRGGLTQALGALGNRSWIL